MVKSNSKKQTKLKLILIICFIIFIIPNKAYSQKEIPAERLLDLSLEELMNISVKTGNITGIALSKTPVSITTITASDLAITPARNLYDIIETYVPGAIFFPHWDSPHIGMRGIITDRNYKYLLLVNGRNMNLKAHNGATSELELWDLSDIEMIEIIRGPGSVTYGPGAVAGIINIRTKTNNGNNNFKSSINYIYPYNSKGLNASYSYKDFYIFGSVHSTQGYENPTVYKAFSYNKYGKISPELTTQVPADYMADYIDKPNIKLHANYNFSDNSSLSVRYTNQGATQNPDIGKSSPQVGIDTNGQIISGKPVNILQTRDQHLSINLNNEKSINELFNLTTLISLSSESYIRNTGWFRSYPSPMPVDSIKYFSDLNSIWNHDYDFSETSLLGRFIINKDFENLKLAFGTELSLNYWGPGWGNDRKSLRMGDNYDIISGTDSYVYGAKDYLTGVPIGKGYFVGNGWTTLTSSVLYELSWELTPEISIMLSGRNDKDSYSKWLFSPRFAIISEFFEDQIFKFVIQRSQRMNTAAQLLIQNKSGISTDPETLTGAELIYSGLISENFSISTSAFYNDLDIISWKEIGRSTKPTGKLQLAGFEIESKLHFENFDITLNHSFTKQLKWTLNEGVLFSGISYSDYSMVFGDTKLSSYGNDLNNWSNNTTKLILNYKLFENKLLLHLNSHIFWNFDGAKNSINMLENAIKPSNKDYQSQIALLNTIKNLDLFSTDFSMNFSAAYNLSENFRLSLFIMNLVGLNNNRRYIYDAGNRSQEQLFRVAFIEEPRTFGMKIDYSF